MKSKKAEAFILFIYKYYNIYTNTLEDYILSTGDCAAHVTSASVDFYITWGNFPLAARLVVRNTCTILEIPIYTTILTSLSTIIINT